ncbi:MAG: PD-(D/E)XK nuclease family protein [Candidatus Methanomethylicaceae archaeon]
MGACTFREPPKPCRWFIGGGYCGQYYYICIDYALKRQPPLSFSSIQSWERCERRFYYSTVLGLEVPEDFRSVELRKGAKFHQIVSAGLGGAGGETWFSDEEWRDRISVEVLAEILLDSDKFDLLEPGGRSEVRVVKNGIVGVVDLLYDDYFCEFKFTSRPEHYLYDFTAHVQLHFYFYLLDGIVSKGFILPIRTPNLKPLSLEGPEEFRERLYHDIVRRPGYYFPRYSPDRTYPKWGLRFFKEEFTQDFSERISYITEDIRRCISSGYWVQRFSNCLTPSQCEFFPVCERGDFLTPDSPELNSYLRKEVA